MPFAKTANRRNDEAASTKKLILFQIWQQGIGGQTSGVGSESDESVRSRHFVFAQTLG
jgi:hypothetical protein